MTAIERLLAGLFDYAGLYPPASLSMRSAASNYLAYSRGEHAWGLGRFIVNLDRIEELRAVAGDSFSQMKLSVIATESTDWSSLSGLIRDGAPIETVEIKSGNAADVERVASQIPHHLATYFEVGIDDPGRAALHAIAAAGARAKIRMGGVVAEAFPASANVAVMLQVLAELRLPFKATAGLHHPIRSRHPFTYKPEGPAGLMHGFLNLVFAATLLHFGGTAGEARKTLEEEDSGAWRVSPEGVRCRAFSWSADQIREVREQFFISIGSCSFEEPIHDLESLGWL